MHGSLLLQSAWMHVRVGSRVETPVLLSVHVHVEAEHLRLAHGAHAGLHGSRRASSMKAGAFIVGAHVQSWLVYVSLSRARVSAINLGTKLLQPKHTPLQSIPHDGCSARHRRSVSDRSQCSGTIVSISKFSTGGREKGDELCPTTHVTGVLTFASSKTDIIQVLDMHVGVSKCPNVFGAHFFVAQKHCIN